MEVGLQILVLAFLVESIVDTMQLVYVEGKVSTPKILALVTGILIAYSVKLNIFTILKIEGIELVGILLAGILISRGGNFINDLFQRIGDGRECL